MNRLFYIILSLTLVFPAFGDIPAHMEHTVAKTIGISQMVEHPALDAVRQGLLESLKEQGFESNKNLNVYYENAQGNLVTATQIASKLLSTRVDLLVAISTPSAQTLLYAAKRNGKQVPIVFTAVSDPVIAKLDAGSHYPITGITDSPNLQDLLKLIKTLLPKMKKIGLMYNPAEPNSVSTITKFKALLKEEDIVVREVTVNATHSVAQAMHSLIGKVDALYFPQDNTVVSAIETVVNIAAPSETNHYRGLPLFCSDPLLVEKGVLAAVGYDYIDIGKETGVVVGRLLNGEDIQNILIHHPPHIRTVINPTVAQTFALSWPKEEQSDTD